MGDPEQNASKMMYKHFKDKIVLPQILLQIFQRRAYSSSLPSPGVQAGCSGASDRVTVYIVTASGN